MKYQISRDRVVTRFLGRVRISDSGCWIWQGRPKSTGYGVMGVGGRSVGAHRLSFELFVGPIPTGLHLDHLCRVPACVNPVHLQAVTVRENVLRGVGPTAVNAQRTHCVNGHPFTEANTRIHRRPSNTARVCRECMRWAQEKFRHRKREAATALRCLIQPEAAPEGAKE